MDSLPLVSIVVAAYNSARAIAETLESHLAQDYPNLEVVVTDDGSQDDTPAILASFGERLRVHRMPNGGLPNARNVGCSLARGDLIAISDADDLYPADRISTLVRAMLANPDAVLCGSDFSAFGADGPIAASYGATYYSQIGESAGGLAALYPRRGILPPPEGATTAEQTETLSGEVYESLAFGNFVHPPTVLFRRRAFESVGGFDREVTHNCDWEFFVRLSRLGPFVHVCRPLVQYRISAHQMSSARGNRGRGALDLVTTSEKIWRADPALAARHAERVRSCRRSFYSHAARMLVEHDKVAAAQVLAAGLRHGALDRSAVNTVAKLMLPSSLTRLLRELRPGRRDSGSGPPSGARNPPPRT